MIKTIKIARLELSILFYSPIAWLVLTIFMVQCGIVFVDNLSSVESTLAAGYSSGAITRNIFTSNYLGLFESVQSNLYLYLPILTMGLMSRETSSGSIKLLLSSPVKLREIILGKYLAIIIYGLLLMGVLAICLIMATFSIEHADVGLVMSGLAGIYLLICTYAAIGLFMSCLTNYQVVAAISTLAVFAALKYIGTLGQNIDFIRDLTYFLSISGRVENMVKGIITTRDIFYYIIIIASFLILSILVLKSQRELKPLSIKIGRYALLIVGALLLGYITSRPAVTKYLDTSKDQAFTLSRTGQEVAKKFDGKLTVTTYGNMLGPNMFLVQPAERNKELSLLEIYKRFIPGMEFKYVYYYEKPVDSFFSTYRFNPRLKGVKDIDTIADVTADTYRFDRSTFISPAEINKQIDLKPEGYAAVRQLEYKGKTSFVRFFNDMNPYASEKEFIAALERLLQRSPKVVFINCNNTRSIETQGDREYQIIGSLKNDRVALVNQGFDVDTVNLNEQDIPADADILVLADPTTPFTPQEQERLNVYIAKGGNMLITGDPERSNVLNPLLSPLGVQLKQGMLMAADKSLSPGFISAPLSAGAHGLSPIIDNLLERKASVGMQGAAAIEQAAGSGFNLDTILTSPAGSWNNKAFDSTTALQPDTIPHIFPVMVSLTRNINNRQQRIVVSGDADFMDNAELSRQPVRGSNEIFQQGLFGWLCNNAFPFNPSRIEPKDTKLLASRGQISLLGWICKGIIPGIIVLIGAIVLLRRRVK